jgi:hypothetical protein
MAIVEDERAARKPRGAMNQIERVMTAGDVIEFTMHDPAPHGSRDADDRR